MGASPGTLLSLLREMGGVPLRNWPLAAAFLASCALRAPFFLAERLLSRRLPGPADPVFIVGHWRSGTTHLHNALAASTGMGVITPLASGLPGELLTLATWLRPLLERALPRDRGLDAVAVSPGSPQEDEIPMASLQPLSAYHAFYLPRSFPQRMERALFPSDTSGWERSLERFLARVARHQGGRRLILKNPVHSLRVPQLAARWPAARFVHIHRNPYRVYPSSVHFFGSMIARLGLQPAGDLDVGGFVLGLYPRFMDRLLEDASRLPPERFAEIRFEDLEARPMEQLERIHRQLELPGAPGAARAYLESVGGYGKNRYRLAPRDREQVALRWGRFVRRWGYQEPPEAA